MSLSELLKAEGLSDTLVKVAVDAGWSINTFKHAADSPAELEKVLPETFVNTELTRLQVAQIRAAWSTLHFGLTDVAAIFFKPAPPYRSRFLG